MAVINSYYLYQKYEKRGNQPWIPCYPNTWSVDADGTMPPVRKQQDDPSCYHPIYRWVQTQDTICIDTTTIEYRTTSGDPYCTGYDKYVDTTTEQSFDGGVTWEFVSSSSTLVETDSEYCGYEPTPEVQYRWTESGTTCDNANKYKRYIKQVSYDGGEAWIVVNPPQYSAGTIVEADSYDCGYRTSATTSATYCSNANQYVDVYSLVSRDYGVTWSTASTSTELIEEDVVECGFSARTISTATTCVGVDKHYLNEYQESRDTGTTWTTISSSTGSLIESNSYDCGYRTGTTSGTPYCSGYDKYVDVYYRTSTDGGTTWVTASTTPTLVEAQSEDCGYVPPTPTQYRWTQSGTTCIGYDKYQNNIKEQSTDGGETWTVVIPEEYSASTLIESQSTDCGYVPPTPTSGDYFTTRALEDGDIIVTPNTTSSIYYSLDSGSTWTDATWVGSDYAISVSSGDTILWKGSEPAGNSHKCKFSSTCNFEVYGNIMSLICRDNFEGKVTFTSSTYTFYGLFANCTKLINAENLYLPATTLVESCYYGMFNGCTNLLKAPSILPATTLARYCYNSMFDGCSNLTTAPQLLATTLANPCCSNMFRGCTSLTTVPSNMLPATTLTTSCYYGMFSGCTSLTTAPELLATTLANMCYAYMFDGCTNLNSVTCLATDISASSCLGNWLRGVAASGTFTKAASMNDWRTGNSGIPSGWTVQDYSS